MLLLPVIVVAASTGWLNPSVEGDEFIPGLVRAFKGEGKLIDFVVPTLRLVRTIVVFCRPNGIEGARLRRFG